jgi:Ni/Co efflux regulator RcnB
MKRAIIAAAALGLLLPGTAMAQSQSDQQYKQGGHPSGSGRPPQGQPQQGRPPQGQPQQSRPPQGRPPQGAPPQSRPPQPRPPQAGGPGYHRPPTYVQPLPPRGNQYWHRGQYYGRVHGPAFAYPPGWRYRQWQIGQRLPPLFLAPGYFYPGYAALGLQVPPPGYNWVRFGPDLLLVNLATNEVEDVIYGVFM